jgi:hypothetical protein
VIALFAFDIGYEVVLGKLSALAASSPVQPLSRKKQTPSFLQYARPPQVVNLGISESLPGRTGQVRATIFDFGAVSIAYTWPLATAERAVPLTELPALSQQVYGRGLQSDAAERARGLLERIAPAVVRQGFSPLVEDYYLFVIEKLDQPVRAADLLAACGPTFAHALRFESDSLSDQQQQEALASALSYYENDLLLTDWNAAVIYDKDFADTVRVFELLNVELLEARYIDSELDRRIQEYARLAQSHREWPIPLRTPFRRAIRDLTELRMESAILAERVGNALKLVGDQYLARVHSTAAERFSLQEWEGIISHKLNTIDRFYQLLTDRLRTAQNQALELAIIILIVIELVLAAVS